MMMKIMVIKGNTGLSTVSEVEQQQLANKQTVCIAVMNRRIAAALIDLSGTLHIEDTLIPGAVEALCRFVIDIFIFIITST